MDNGPGKVFLCLKEYAKKIKPDSKDAKKWAGLESDINVQEKSCPSACQDLRSALRMKEPENPLADVRRAVGRLTEDLLERFL